MIPNLSDYQIKKERKLLSLSKVGNAYAIAMKRFSPETGEQLADEVSAVGIDEVDTRIAKLNKQLKEIQDFKADLEALGWKKESENA